MELSIQYKRQSYAGLCLETRIHCTFCMLYIVNRLLLYFEQDVFGYFIHVVQELFVKFAHSVTMYM